MVTSVPGHAIKRYRNLHGLTQEALAHALGVSQVTVSRWENGKQEPDLATQKRLIELIYGRPVLSDDAIREMFVQSYQGVSAVIDVDCNIVTKSRVVASLSDIASARLLGLDVLRSSMRRFVTEAHQAQAVLLGMIDAGAPTESVNLRRAYVPIVIDGREHLLVAVIPSVPGLP